MMLTLKHIMKLKQEPIVLRLLLICCLGLVVSCSGLKPFPVDTVVEYDAKNQVCGLYKITDYENLKFEYVSDTPCSDLFGFKAKDMPKVLDWEADAIKYSKQHCK